MAAGKGSSSRPRMVKVMCHYGGSISMPSPLDGSPPCYVGGVATLVTLQRHTTYGRLAAEMRKLYGGPVTIKYYLQEGPDKGLDAETTMVEVVNGRDVSNMMMLLESGISSDDGAGSGAGIHTRSMSIFLYPQQQQQQQQLVDDGGNELKRMDDLYTVAELGRRLPRLCPIDVLVPTNREYEEDGWFIKTLRRNSGSDVEGFWETAMKKETGRYEADACLDDDEQQQQLDEWNEWNKRPELSCAAADTATPRLSSSSCINLCATNREHERMRWFMKKTLGRDSGNLDSEVEEHFSAYLGEVSSTRSLIYPPSMDELVMDIMKSSNKILSHNILDDIILDGSAEPTNLPFALLQEITENFSDEQKIGSGGFANVYKGSLINGSVAIKKLLNSQTIGEETFYREANFLMNVKHPNIVRFLGFCANTENQAIKLQGPGTYAKYIYAEVRERLLCFEYISNGSLDKHLKDELEGLEWHTRYQIIKGICEGLHYLHLEKCILHMDMKPANILLDHLMVPKITDFGISRHLDGISRAITKELFMSLGYCAPEYLLRGEVSFKTDIYGLGVIIKEIVTGRKEVPNIKKILRRWRYRWNKLAMCPPLGYQQVTKCIELAVRCMAEDSKTRPFIWDIVSVLNETETKDEDISSAKESMGGQIKPYPWELLSLDPLELSFPFEPNEQTSCTLELTNDRDDQIGFDIEAMNPFYEYKIEPNKGMVPPHSACNVAVTLEAQQKAPQGMMRMDRLTVRMAVVGESLAAKDITPDMFDGEMGNMVDEVDLAVVFTN